MEMQHKLLPLMWKVRMVTILTITCKQNLIQKFLFHDEITKERWKFEIHPLPLPVLKISQTDTFFPKGPFSAFLHFSLDDQNIWLISIRPEVDVKQKFIDRRISTINISLYQKLERFPFPKIDKQKVPFHINMGIKWDPMRPTEKKTAAKKLNETDFIKLPLSINMHSNYHIRFR